MFNLNGEEFKSQTVAIFNNGEAGKVDNVNISVAKKTVEDADNAPDYKVIFTNATGSVNMGIYYPTDESTPGQTKLTVSKGLAIARAVMGDEYEFPEVGSAKEAIDVCMKLVNKNQDKALVTILVTYGTQGSPKNFLGVYKNFDFIEKTGSTPSKLKITRNPSKPQYDDLTERIVADAPSAPTAGTPAPSTESWI